MVKQNSPIGIFDSGIGGLTFLKTVLKLLPQENYIYFGDNKNAPYGDLSGLQIYNHTNRAFKYFEKKGVKAVVIACNTVTAECAKKLRANYLFKIIGMEPAVNPAAKSYGKITVLCTRATANSQKFKKLLENYNNVNVKVPYKLVDIIEDNIYNLNNFAYDFEKYIKGAENIVLGCTHFVFLKDILKNYGVKVFDGNCGTAKCLYNYLKSCNKLNEGNCGRILFKGSGKSKNRKVFYKVMQKNVN